MSQLGLGHLLKRWHRNIQHVVDNDAPEQIFSEMKLDSVEDFVTTILKYEHPRTSI